MVWLCFNVFWLAKTILQGTVTGKRKRGRQKKRSEDNNKEWTGMDFASSTRVAKNRARGYKTFFMLNSIEHEILNAHKYKNIKKFSFF